MPRDKEKKKEYMKEYNRLYRLKNKENIKKYRNDNKERQLIYNKTEKGKKSMVIGNWRRWGILCFDWDLLYDIFLSITNCEFCNVELNTNGATRKCLDHDHSINDKFNVRGVLCKSCNFKDVLK
mgnify:CR=1 FL=1|tara:strand:- start:30 stop:401 length:372 start_codon:yes stop_codon:yes gene_type:complete